jgi:hypothetical protein
MPELPQDLEIALALLGRREGASVAEIAQETGLAEKPARGTIDRLRRHEYTIINLETGSARFKRIPDDRKGAGSNVPSKKQEGEGS